MKKIFLFLFLFLLSGLLTHQSLWLDEASSVKAANLSFNDLLTKYAPSDFHPGLYHVILHYWVLIGGAGEDWVRLVSVVAVLLTSLLVYAVGKQYVGKRWGLVAAGTFGTGPLVFYYSGEARMYALAVMWVTLSFWGFLMFLKTRLWQWWSVWVLGMTLSVYTDYVPVLVQPVFLLAVLWISEAQNVRLRIFLGFVIEGLLFAPWLPIFFHQLVNGAMVQSAAPGWWKLLGPLSVKSVLLLWVKMIIGRISFMDKFVYGAVVGIVSLIFGVMLVSSRKAARLGVVWLWLVVPVFLGAILALRVAIFQYFRFLFIAPTFYLLVTAGASKFGRKAGILLVAANLIFDAIYFFTPRFYREDWRGVTDYIKNNRRQSSVALFPNSGQADAYKYYGTPSVVVEPSAWYSNSPSEVWLFRYVQEVFDPQDNLRKQLQNRGYRKIEEKSFNQLLVWRYERL